MIPAELECVRCGGDKDDCPECKGTGIFTVTRCPLDEVTQDVWDALDYADLYEKGLPPIAGGALDQAYAFTQACSFIWSEKARHEAELRIKD